LKKIGPFEIRPRPAARSFDRRKNQIGGRPLASEGRALPGSNGANAAAIAIIACSCVPPLALMGRVRSARPQAGLCAAGCL
jgi:hypothetical protein